MGDSGSIFDPLLPQNPVFEVGVFFHNFCMAFSGCFRPFLLIARTKWFGMGLFFLSSHLGPSILSTCWPFCTFLGTLGGAQMAPKKSKMAKKTCFSVFTEMTPGHFEIANFFPLSSSNPLYLTLVFVPDCPVLQFLRKWPKMWKKGEKWLFHVFDCGEPQTAHQWYMKLPGAQNG